MKPRCRWRIDIEIVEDELALGRFKPYRLQAQLIENRRESGRVRQEHVATLGSVEGWLLPELWEGIDPALVAKVKADDWDMHSVKARAAFWDGAKLRLDGLANRLDPKAIRLTVHQRVPWPMQAERDLAQARSDFRFWRTARDGQVERLQHQEQLGARVTQENAELREKAREYDLHVAEAVGRLARLR